MLNTREQKSSLHEENSSIAVCIGHPLVKCHFLKSSYIFTHKENVGILFKMYLGSLTLSLHALEALKTMCVRRSNWEQNICLKMIHKIWSPIFHLEIHNTLLPASVAKYLFSLIFVHAIVLRLSNSPTCLKHEGKEIVTVLNHCMNYSFKSIACS